MAKSVLELAVGTGQWDAGLKKAKSALDNFTQSQGGLQQALAKDSENMRKFVSMMGQTESTAKTAKGQMNDYKATIEQLTMQYNRMTDAQKKSIGQDYLQSIDQLKQKYQAVNEEIQEMNRSLNNVKAPDVADGVKASGLFGGGKLDGMLQVFGGNIMTKGFEMATGAITSMVNETATMIKQGVELAKQGEGIRIAFERLGRGDILDGLREATHGTVTDLELMKAAVKFNDFKLPLDELGTMLAFAQQKAKDTGQSVDYMVDSIVTGLGRKSLMILDNLGLSAAEIKERMKETGDMTKAVGSIIRDQMAKAGDYVETAADRAAQANVSLQNKMEELGRKFAPLEEASNNFWTSMKIGILDVVGGPLANLLNKLTEAGRLMNAYGKMGGSGKVGRMTANLAGASEGSRQSIYQQQQAQFWKYINPREQQIKDIRAWQSGERNEALQKRIGVITEKYGSLDITKIQAEVDAAKKMLSEYQQAAKQILSPVKVNIQTDNAIKSVDELKVKLAELQAQRKKVAAGSDEAKRLDTEIRQVKADIKLQDPNSLKTTGGKSKQQQAEDKVSAALQDYQQTIDKANLELKSGAATEADVKKKQLSAQERLYDAYGDAYALYKDPKYKDAQDKAAEEIVKLGGEVKAATEAQEAARKAARELESAQKKLADAQKELANAQTSGDLKKIYAAEKKVETAQQAVTQSSTITVKVEGKEALEQLQKLEGIQTVKVNVEEGNVNLPQVPTEDQTIKVNVEEGDVNLPKVPTDDQTIKVNVEEGKVNLPQVPTDDKTIRVNVVVDNAEAIQSIQQLEGVTIDVPVNYKPQGGNLQPVEIPLTTANIDAFTSHIKEELANADLGSSAALSLQERLSDATAIGTILQTAIQNGIDTAQFDTSGLMKRLMNHEDISDEEIQSYVDQLNAMLKAKFDETEWPKVLIKFNIDTKSIEKMSKQQQKDAQGMAKEWQVVGNSISAVGSAMNSIKDPTAKIVGIVMSGIASTAQGAGQAISKAGSTTTSWYEYLAAAAAITAQMITTISQIHDVTGYASGGIVGGNSYSGDNLRMPVDGGGMIGVNSGELILNRSQQDSLAAQLRGSGTDGLQLSAEISGEDIIMVLDRRSVRRGKGEYVTTGRRY